MAAIVGFLLFGAALLFGWLPGVQSPSLATSWATVSRRAVSALAAVVLELAFPEKVLPVLLNIVGSTCLLVWASALLAQLALRLRADREGMELPLQMPGFPWLTSLGVLILAVVLTVGLIGEESRPRLLSTLGLVALLAVAN